MFTKTKKKQQLDSLARGGFGARNARYLRPRRRGGGGVAAEGRLIESLPRRAVRACTAPNFLSNCQWLLGSSVDGRPWWRVGVCRIARSILDFTMRVN